MKITVGTRTSPLALVQIDEIESLLKNAEGVDDFAFVRKTYTSQGDTDKKTPLFAIKKDDVFTDQLDRAILAGEIDIAIHSAKDLPKKLPEGLMIYALTESPDATDAFVGRVPFGQLPKGAKIGTSSGFRQERLRQLNPELEPVAIRGTIQERIEQFEQGKYDGIIVATIALKRLGLEDYIMGILPWDGIPLQGQLAVVGHENNRSLRNFFKTIDVRQQYGCVYLVGSGPGDPELITLKAIRVLNEADVVLYDYLTHKDTLKHAAKADLIYTGKRKGAHSIVQSELNQKLRDLAFAGKTVVRLKCGDPFIFGRGAEELAYLREYFIPIDVIPGVSSATAVATGLGIPLTARDLSSSVSFISAHTKDEKAQEGPIKVPDTDTIVYLMGLTKLEKIVKALIKKYKDKNRAIAVISRATYRDEKIVVGTLADIEHKVTAANVLAPCIILFGDVLRFYKEKPVLPQKVLFTGTNPERFTGLGEICSWPMIQIAAQPLDEIKQSQLRDDFDRADIVLFTSRYGVQYFFQFLHAAGLTAEAFKGKAVFVIGTTTADELIDHDVHPTLMANIETSHGLLDVIREKHDVDGKRILFPRSALPNPTLKDELTALGAEVKEVSIYTNTKPPKRDLCTDDFDAAFFTSPSTVRNFLEDYKCIPAHWRILAKGEVTAEYLKKKGYKSEVLINT